MKRITLLFSLLLVALATGVAQAQERTVTGQVTNAETLRPLAGVQVVVQGTGVGTITDSNGNYSVRVPAGATTLQFRSLGFRTEEEAITGTTVNVALQPEAVALEGVVVTALGIERERRSLGTAVQDIQGEEVLESRETNIVNTLSGRVAGVQITNAGPAGGSSRIVIRGATSIAGNNQPLFIVDGVPINNDAPKNFGYGGYGNETGGVDYGNAAQDINPNDIESITVLKGPNAAALYGSRAANGAIIITTKSGRGAGEFDITFNSSSTFEDPLRLPDYQDRYGQGLFGAFEFVDGAGGGLFDFVDESWGPPLDAGLCIRQFYDAPGECSPWVSNPNNVASFFETGVTLNNSVSLATASDRANVRMSLSNLTQDGMYPGQELNRTSVTLNGGANLTDRLNASASVNYVTSEGQNRPGTGYDATNPMQQFVWFGRQVDVERLRDYKVEDTPVGYGGTPFNWNYNYHANPFWIALENRNFDQRDRVIGQASVSYQFLPWLQGSLQSGTDWYRDNRQRTYAAGFIDFPQGAFQENDIYFNETNTQLLFSGNRDLSDALDFGFTLGANHRTNDFSHTYTTVGELIVPGTYNVSNAAISPDIRDELQEKAVNSAFGSVNFGFRDVAFLELTGRNDWSSTLPEENNSYFYPSVSTSLIVSDLLGASADQWYGKLRASWARVGNDADPYQLQAVYSSNVPFGNVPRFEVPNVIPNADLKPEITESWELGTELSALNDRVGLDLTYYDQVTENQILSASISAASGYTGRVLNAGSIRNRGVEALLSVVPVSTGDFRWEMSANFAKNNSEVQSLYPGLQTITLGGLTYWGVSAEARVGEPYGQLYGIGYTRDDQGRIVVDPATGLPIPDNSRRIALGNYNPDWLGGLRNRLSYKNVDFSVLFDIRQGGEIFSVTNMFGNYAGVLESSLRGRENGVTTLYDDEGNVVGQECDPGIVVEGVTPSGQPNTTRVCPQDYFGHLYYLDEPHVYDASFVKLREVKLDWSVPQSILDRTPFSTMEIGLIGRNLALWTNVPNIDPETAFDASNRQGFEFGQLPSARSIGFNITIRP